MEVYAQRSRTRSVPHHHHHSSKGSSYTTGSDKRRFVAAATSGDVSESGRSKVLHPLAPQAEDYSAVFGSFLSGSRGCSSSIPILDLPSFIDDGDGVDVVDEESAGAGFDYSQVFGGVQLEQFGLTCDELFRGVREEPPADDDDDDDESPSPSDSTDSSSTGGSQQQQQKQHPNIPEREVVSKSDNIDHETTHKIENIHKELDSERWSSPGVVDDDIIILIEDSSGNVSLETTTTTLISKTCSSSSSPSHQGNGKFDVGRNGSSPWFFDGDDEQKPTSRRRAQVKMRSFKEFMKRKKDGGTNNGKISQTNGSGHDDHHHHVRRTRSNNSAARRRTCSYNSDTVGEAKWTKEGSQYFELTNRSNFREEPNQQHGADNLERVELESDQGNGIGTGIGNPPMDHMIKEDRGTTGFNNNTSPEDSSSEVDEHLYDDAPPQEEEGVPKTAARAGEEELHDDVKLQDSTVVDPEKSKEKLLLGDSSSGTDDDDEGKEMDKESRVCQQIGEPVESTHPTTSNLLQHVKPEQHLSPDENKLSSSDPSNKLAAGEIESLDDVSSQAAAAAAVAVEVDSKPAEAAQQHIPFPRRCQSFITRQEANQSNLTSTKEIRERAERLERVRRAFEEEQLRKLEEEREREREREREKDRMKVELLDIGGGRALAEARQRAALERAAAEARERLETASAEKSYSDQAAARLRAEARERAAVDRATAEARERAAVDKAKAERAAYEAREQQLLKTSLDSAHNVSAHDDQRCDARLQRHRRTAQRVAEALAEKNKRDLIAQREQAERNRYAESLNAEIKRWSNGKEGNLRALLATLQHILGPDSGWQPIPLTQILTPAAAKKAYRKATLCVHPDKLQQRGATVQHKYVCEKVFDLLKDAWNRFNSGES